MIRHRVLPIVLGCAVLLGIPATAPAQEPQSAQQQASAAAGAPPREVIVVPAGTNLPLVLHTGMSTRTAKPGRVVYFETVFPIVADGHVAIPAGSFVGGVLEEVKRPGRVKGRGEVLIRLDRLVMPNGYAVRLDALPSDVSAGEKETITEEGRVRGRTAHARDAGIVTVGALKGLKWGLVASIAKGRNRLPHYTGAGIGGGVLVVLLTRGPELEISRGAIIEATLRRPLELDPARLQFSDAGRATVVQIPGRPLDQDSARRWP